MHSGSVSIPIDSLLYQINYIFNVISVAFCGLGNNTRSKQDKPAAEFYVRDVDAFLFTYISDIKEAQQVVRFLSTHD